MPRILTVKLIDWKKRGNARNTGSAGARIFRSGNGERCEKTTAPMELPGNISFPAPSFHGANLRWGEDGIAGFATVTSDLLRACLMDGKAPLLKGTSVWTYRQPRESWRRCEGMLFYTWITRDTTVHAHVVHIPAAAFLIAGWWRKTQSAPNEPRVWGVGVGGGGGGGGGGGVLFFFSGGGVELLDDGRS